MNDERSITSFPFPTLYVFDQHQKGFIVDSICYFHFLCLFVCCLTEKKILFTMFSFNATLITQLYLVSFNLNGKEQALCATLIFYNQDICMYNVQLHITHIWMKASTVWHHKISSFFLLFFILWVKCISNEIWIWILNSKCSIIQYETWTLQTAVDNVNKQVKLKKLGNWINMQCKWYSRSKKNNDVEKEEKWRSNDMINEHVMPCRVFITYYSSRQDEHTK